MGLDNESGGPHKRINKICRTAQVIQSVQVWYTTREKISGSWLPTRNAQFRSAIKEKVGSGTLVNGIFLDCSGSAQMRAGTPKATGDSRKVFSMVALR
ncbi:hypothetical protein IAQ67_15560 [Paenibacillus peoriae]|uniref:Uncharacterized protein n=1 Tax=Paenibacillus peoriae TaxID=59893 RepID=A0A7H0Y2K6_9BACL|nr:hypothetical protein [Paenibacillus peoriae]QNR65314.1 hypothetical protein IAQ67_15560 [Paenibacillus peoriae]